MYTLFREPADMARLNKRPAESDADEEEEDLELTSSDDISNTPPSGTVSAFHNLSLHSAKLITEEAS